MTKRPVVFPETVRFKAPEGFLSAVQQAADADHTTVADIIRRGVLDALRSRGIHLKKK